MSSTMRNLLGEHRIIPVVEIADAEQAAPLGNALARGGLGCAEVTLRTPAAFDAITRMAENAPVLVGAGTVVHPDDLRRAVDAGARFIVSPGLDPDLLRLARELDVPILPGCATATEVQLAQRHGMDAVKFFPADRLGGLPTIATLASPFPGVGFVPSGGVTPASAREYLAHPAVLAVCGSWMVRRELVTTGAFETIERLSREAAST